MNHRYRVHAIVKGEIEDALERGANWFNWHSGDTSVFVDVYAGDKFEAASMFRAAFDDVDLFCGPTVMIPMITVGTRLKGVVA
ncbi:hypothetical protein N9104_01710 [Pseudomonadales bacterium]|nr:hypothetical protein [Pseudomonadales bacterium]